MGKRYQRGTVTVWSLGSWTGLPWLIALILLTELGSVRLGGERGAFWWTTFHFIGNPLACVLYSILTLAKTLRRRPLGAKILHVLPIVVPIGFLYLAVTGNTWWLEVLRVRFH